MKDYKDIIDFAGSDNVNYKKFCDGVKKIVKRIDDECDEGDRQVRLITDKFTPEDIIQETKKEAEDE